MKSDAVLSPTKRYRYALWREWDATLPRVTFLLLNPSTADARRDDPTIRRCIAFARRWGFGSIAVGNIFALRATNPTRLREVRDPVGPQNDRWLRRLARESELVVAGWGEHGRLANRAAAVSEFLPALHCLQQNASGQPKHPLYIRGDRRPVPWPA